MPHSGTIRRDDGGDGEPTNGELRVILDTHFTHMNARLDRVVKFIDGDSEPERGAKIRLDRLEQADERRKLWVGAAIVAGVGSVVASVWASLTGHH